MFAYCRNNPVCRIDAAGTVDYDCIDDQPLDQEDILQTGEGGGGNATVSGSRGYAVSSGSSQGRSSKLTFSSQSKLSEHYSKHNSEFGNAFGSEQEYVDAANYVIETGQYIEGSNAYVKFYGYQGRANYAFVGVSRDHNYITTFHLKHAVAIFY